MRIAKALYLQKLTIALVVLVGFLLSQHHPAAAQTPTAGLSIAFPAGWNLVSFPAGTSLSSLPGPLYTLQPGDTNYEVVQPSQGSKNGVGYWAYFAAPTTLILGAGSTASMQVALPPRQWAMLGNPSGGSEFAKISGIDSACYYDPRSGYNCGPCTVAQCVQLNPGQGAWVYSASGGIATISLVEFPSP